MNVLQVRTELQKQTGPKDFYLRSVLGFVGQSDSRLNHRSGNSLGKTMPTDDKLIKQDSLPFPPTPSASIAGRTMQESVYRRTG